MGIDKRMFCCHSARAVPTFAVWYAPPNYVRAHRHRHNSLEMVQRLQIPLEISRRNNLTFQRLTEQDVLRRWQVRSKSAKMSLADVVKAKMQAQRMMSRSLTPSSSPSSSDGNCNSTMSCCLLRA